MGWGGFSVAALTQIEESILNEDLVSVCSMWQTTHDTGQMIRYDFFCYCFSPDILSLLLYIRLVSYIFRCHSTPFIARTWYFQLDPWIHSNRSESSRHHTAARCGLLVVGCWLWGLCSSQVWVAGRGDFLCVCV